MLEGKSISSRRQKLRKQDQEGYAASLDKERKRKYLIKYRNRGSDVPPARVGDDISNPDGGVAGGPPALVGDVTQPPTGAPAVDLSTAQQNTLTASHEQKSEPGPLQSGGETVAPSSGSKDREGRQKQSGHSGQPLPSLSHHSTKHHTSRAALPRGSIQYKPNCGFVCEERRGFAACRGNLVRAVYVARTVFAVGHLSRPGWGKA